MDDSAKLLGAIWPAFVIGALTLAVVFALLRSSAASLKAVLGQLRQDHDRLRFTLGETDRRVATLGEQQQRLVDHVAQAARELEQQRQRLESSQAAAMQQPPSRDDSRDDEASVVCPPESIERFNAAADALSLVARELESFDSRQAENWLRIKGDLQEQAFQLQRVQQHVDRLFAAPPSAAAAASVG